MTIHKVAVIGAGVMGASIAAHISNAGIPVLLLDRVPEHAPDRDSIAKTAIQQLLKAQPAAFMHPHNARLITPGNTEDHLQQLADCDWVLEAIVEQPHIKQALYQQLEKVCPEQCIISSNTSTLPLHLLVAGMPARFKQRFMISHFFNPPRYMRLLELVSGPDTRPELLADLRQFADLQLGKDCVQCQDTPGFIGNRIGIFWLQCALQEAIALGVSVTEADAVMTLFGIPKTGVFGLMDLVGLDLIPHVLASMATALAPEDVFQQLKNLPEIVQQMIAQGLIGKKASGGFYRLNAAHQKEAINLTTGVYEPIVTADLTALLALKKSGIAALFSGQDKLSVYAWRVWAKTLCYAATVLPEIADDVLAIDTALREGYNWQQGPFELLDNIGLAAFVGLLTAKQHPIPTFFTTLMASPSQQCYPIQGQQLCVTHATGQQLPLHRPAGVLLLADCKRLTQPIISNASASLWAVGDGIACLELHSKMNTLDHDNLTLMQHSIDKVQTDFAALVIYSDCAYFSAGANLHLLSHAIRRADWAAIEALIDLGQHTYQALKYAPFPVVAAASGLALGGGCELLLHCDAIQAHAELYMGLVEVGVGLIPCWGGCKEYLLRCMHSQNNGPMPPIMQAFATIGTASVSKSAADARDYRFLRPHDRITANPSRLLADAKALALSLTPHYTPPAPAQVNLPGKSAHTTMHIAVNSLHLQGKATDYDVIVSEQLASVLSGGPCDITTALSETDLLALEKQAFMALVKQPGTLARLEHMLATGKALRN